MSEGGSTKRFLSSTGELFKKRKRKEVFKMTLPDVSSILVHSALTKFYSSSSDKKRASSL